jgi:hypothetical protein
MDTTASEPGNLFQEYDGYFELGDLEAAAAALDRLPDSVKHSAGANSRRLRLAVTRGDTDAAVAFARVPEIQEQLSTGFNLPFVMGCMGGDFESAYRLTIDQEASGKDNPLYWFNRACYASRCNQLDDAAISLGRCFSWRDHFCADAFLDPDLQNLWNCLETAPLNLRSAELLLNGVWRDAIICWGARKEPLVVPLTCWESIPEHMREYIPRAEGKNGLCPMDSMPGDFYRSYLKWQEDVSGKNMIRLLRAMVQGEKVLDDYQAVFAFEQGLAGNVTAARYHYLRHLAIFPDRPLPKDALERANLGHLAADLRDALIEDPLLTRKLEHLRWATHPLEDIETAEDIIETIGPAGRRTKLFAFRSISLDILRERTETAWKNLQPLLDAWPFEASLFAAGIECAARMGRWEIARSLQRRAPESYAHFHVSDIQSNWIRHEAMDDTMVPTSDFFGQRNLGGHLKVGEARRSGHINPTTFWDGLKVPGRQE